LEGENSRETAKTPGVRHNFSRGSINQNARQICAGKIDGRHPLAVYFFLRYRVEESNRIDLPEKPFYRLTVRADWFAMVKHTVFFDQQG